MADPRFGRPLGRRGGALARLAVGAATLVLILAACGGPAAGSPAPSVAAASTPSPTPEVTASPEPTATAVVTPAPTQVAVGECTADPATAVSAGWVEQVSLSGDYRFGRPADWADLSGDVTLPTTNVPVSPQTSTEAGLGPGATVQIDAVRSFDSAILVTAWVVEGVETRTEPLFARELAWLETQPQIKAVNDAELETCIGGSMARGFSSTGTTPSGDTNFVIFMLQRNGKMYEVQLTAIDPAAEIPYREVLNSWEFTEPLQGPTDPGDQFEATNFKVIGMAAALDKSIPGHPNPATFQDVFPAASGFIYVIYELDDGAADMVSVSWARAGRQPFGPEPFEYKETTTFAWGWITPDASGNFDTGSYTVTLTLQNSGHTITVPFTIE